MFRKQVNVKLVYMVKIINIILFVLLPILIGGLIYIVSRPKSLKMFRWFENLNIDNLTNSFRAAFFHIDFPYWVKYNLPDLLWVFSFTSLILIIWNKEIIDQNVFYVIFPVSVGILSEIGQLFCIIGGTFDLMDILFYSIGGLLSALLFINSKSNENEKASTSLV
jgi:hypothetical protein